MPPPAWTVSVPVPACFCTYPSILQLLSPFYTCAFFTLCLCLLRLHTPLPGTSRCCYRCRCAAVRRYARASARRARAYAALPFCRARLPTGTATAGALPAGATAAYARSWSPTCLFYYAFTFDGMPTGTERSAFRRYPPIPLQVCGACVWCRSAYRFRGRFDVLPNAFSHFRAAALLCATALNCVTDAGETTRGLR